MSEQTTRNAAAPRGRVSSWRQLPPWQVVVLLAAVACTDAVTVPPPVSDEPAQVEIVPDILQLLVGNEITVAAEVRTAQGTVLPSATPRWASGNPSVATVDENGLVHANSPGQAKVFASAGVGQDSVEITVPEPAGFVSPDGGVVETPGGEVRLVVLPNSVSGPEVVSIVAADASALPSGAAVLAGTAYEFGPAGLTFAPPATLSIRYDRSLTNALGARRLRLHKLSGDAWTPVAGSTVDTAAARVNGPIGSFSIYAVAPVPNETPVVTISSPAAGSEFGSGTAIEFMGTAADGEDGSLTGASLTWASSLSGSLGSGTKLVRSDLPLGNHVVSLTAADSEGASGVAQVAITIVDGPPVVTILRPSVDTVAKLGDAIVFRGTAADHVDGAIPSDSLSWTSSLDGLLGAGDSIAAPGLSLGVHVITLTARDSQGKVGRDSVSVSVKANSAPLVTITNPSEGASVGDLTGVTFQGIAADPEDGLLSGAAMVWSSNLEGVLGVGTNLTRSGLTVGGHLVTLTATDSDGAKASVTVSFTVFAEPPPLHFPQLAFVSEAAGTLTLSVSNSAAYDNVFFTTTPSLPPCGANPNPSRTWVEVYDGNGTLLTVFCDFNDRSDLASFAFTPATPPARIYIELWDRVIGQRVRSGSVVPVPSVPTTIEGLVVNDGDADLNTLDPGETLSGVSMQLIVDVNGNGVIDSGEPIWATTSTNGGGAYSFTNLFPRNYIVRALSPSNATVLRALSPTGSVVDQTGTLLTTAVAGAGATLNQSGTNHVGTTNPPGQGDELPRWGYALGTAAPDTGLEPRGPGPNSMNGALTTAPAHFVFLYKTGSVSGSVKTGGAGVPGVRMTITRCQTAPAAPFTPAQGACTQKHGAPSPHIANVDTDANGNYRARNLLEGVYQIDIAPLTGGYGNVVSPVGPSSYLAVIRGNGDNAIAPDFIIN